MASCGGSATRPDAAIVTGVLRQLKALAKYTDQVRIPKGEIIVYKKDVSSDSSKASMINEQ